jgi:hypothetical protein
LTFAPLQPERNDGSSDELQCRVTHYCPGTSLTFPKKPLSANAQLIHLQLGRGEQ